MRSTWRACVDATGVPRFIAGMSGWRRLALGVMREPAAQPWRLTEMWIEDSDGVRIVLAGVPADHPLRRDPCGRSGITVRAACVCRLMATSEPCGAAAQRTREAPDTIE